ncbi:hypothetical protein J1614_009245 [Plenodomus biglobosus]|nr:hypothetical protein J1614_009245 [Plenodomus biglobosus]
MSHGTLYSAPESGNSYKVRLLAALLKLDVEIVDLDLQNDEQHSAAFLKINPRGEVPVLVDGDKMFSDSSAILVWLAGKAETSYWSSDVGEQAAIVNWLAFANSWIQFGVFTNRAILSYNGPYNGLGTNASWSPDQIETFLQEGAIRGNKSLAILQQQLEREDWLALGRPTIADVSVFVYVALAPMGDVGLEPYPAVGRWIARIKGLEGFVGIVGLEDALVRRR